MAKKTTDNPQQDADSRTKHYAEIERTQGEEPGAPPRRCTGRSGRAIRTRR